MLTIRKFPAAKIILDNYLCKSPATHAIYQLPPTRATKVREGQNTVISSKLQNRLFSSTFVLTIFSMVCQFHIHHVVCFMHFEVNISREIDQQEFTISTTEIDHEFLFSEMLSYYMHKSFWRIPAFLYINVVRPSRNQRPFAGRHL